VISPPDHTPFQRRRLPKTKKTRIFGCVRKRDAKAKVENVSDPGAEGDGDRDGDYDGGKDNWGCQGSSRNRFDKLTHVHDLLIQGHPRITRYFCVVHAEECRKEAHWELSLC